MYRYRNNIKFDLVFDSYKWGNKPEFGVEATANSGTMVRIEMDRTEALRMRSALTLYLKATAPVRKKKKVAA